MKYYFTIDNGTRPFCVHIDESQNKVHIYKRDYVEDYKTRIGCYKYCNIFIGLSPLNQMTEYSEGHGSYFDGNSILVHLEGLSYMFIGYIIYTFTALHEITHFVSPVGNNNVPYPYATDCQNNCYFMMYNSIGSDSGVLNISDLSIHNDPYKHLYHMLGDHFRTTINVDHLYLKNNNEYNEYNWDTSSLPIEIYNDAIKRFDSVMYIKFKGESKRLIEKEEYIRTLEDYNQSIGLLPLSNVKVIHNRIF